MFFSLIRLKCVWVLYTLHTFSTKSTHTHTYTRQEDLPKYFVCFAHISANESHADAPNRMSLQFGCTSILFVIFFSLCFSSIHLCCMYACLSRSLFRLFMDFTIFIIRLLLLSFFFLVLVIAIFNDSYANWAKFYGLRVQININYLCFCSFCVRMCGRFCYSPFAIALSFAECSADASAWADEETRRDGEQWRPR